MTSFDSINAHPIRGERQQLNTQKRNRTSTIDNPASKQNSRGNSLNANDVANYNTY